MNSRTTAERIGIVGGVALVVIGALMLLGLGGPVAWTLTSLMGSIASVVWPLTLVAAGVALLAVRTRSDIPSHAPSSGQSRRVMRSRDDRVITGLLGGVADYLGIPAGLVRAAFVVVTLMSGLTWGFVVYIVCSLLIPEAPANPQAVAVR